MSQPLVTVLMPVYNEERYLPHSMDSILNQTYQNLEFLIINDGSTDRTEDIILSYKDPRIKYFKNPTNLKLIATLNKGLKLANGKYIARMDSDDICSLNRIEKQVAVMENNEEIAVCGTAAKIFGETSSKNIYYPETNEQLKIHTLFAPPFAHSAVLIRNSIIRDNNFTYNENYLHVEDWKLWFDMMKKNCVFYNIPEILLHYRLNPGSVSFLYKELQNENSVNLVMENINYFFPKIKIDIASVKAMLSNSLEDNNFQDLKSLDQLLGSMNEARHELFNKVFFFENLFNIWSARLIEFKAPISKKISLIYQSELLKKSYYLIFKLTVIQIIHQYSFLKKIYYWVRPNL